MQEYITIDYRQHLPLERIGGVESSEKARVLEFGQSVGYATPVHYQDHATQVAVDAGRLSRNLVVWLLNLDRILLAVALNSCGGNKWQDSNVKGVVS